MYTQEIPSPGWSSSLSIPLPYANGEQSMLHVLACLTNFTQGHESMPYIKHVVSIISKYISSYLACSEH